MTGSLSVKELCRADAKLDDTVSVIKKKNDTVSAAWITIMYFEDYTIWVDLGLTCWLDHVS